MTDTEIANYFGIPGRTLARWKLWPEEDWRRKMYLFIKTKLEEEKHALYREEINFNRKSHSSQ